MKVLLATDGSQHAKHAARFLSRLPHKDPLELSIVSSVVYPQLHPADAVTTWPPEVWDQLRAAAESAVDESALLFEGADAAIDKRIVDGHAGQAIIDQANKIGAELVVLGAKGHSAVSRLLLGSVSDYVASHAECGVLVVRPPKETDDSAALTTTIAYDGSPRADRAIEQFVQFKWGPATKTHVLTLIPIVRFFGRDVLPEKMMHLQEQHEIAAQAAAHAMERLASTETRVESHTIETEHVGEQIVGFADRHASDLVVVGATGFSGISRLLLGSVSQYVLRHATCSLWIAR